MGRLENAYKEVNEILDIMGEKYKKRIPEKFIIHMKEKQNSKYKSKIKKGIKFEEQELLDETKVLLAFIYRKYWSN